MVQTGQLILSPLETILLVVDIQKDFLGANPGFVFHDAKIDTSGMREMVNNSLVPFILYSLKEKTHVAYVQAEYPAGKFPNPYGRLCSASPGTGFYAIDKIPEAEKVKIFSKSEYDIFTNQDLARYILENNITNAIVAGITTTSCINAALSSTLAPSGLRLIVPKNVVGHRKEQEEKAQTILASYSNAENQRVMIISDWRQIIYR